MAVMTNIHGINAPTRNGSVSKKQSRINGSVRRPAVRKRLQTRPNAFVQGPLQNVGTVGHVMKVRVLVGDQQIDVSCGDGKQSFQWLASVTQGRLKIFNVMRKQLETDQYIVTEIRNTSGELINPKDKLYEHAGPSGLTVRATVETSFPVDTWENPVMNEWLETAYVHSQTGMHWAKEIEAWRNNLDRLKATTPKGADVNFNTALLASKVLPHTSRLIKIGFDFSENDLETAFSLDWQGMKWSWVSIGDAQRNKIGDVVKNAYSLICNVFAHYAGVGKVGQRYGMTVEEFGHFLHFARVANWKEEEFRIEEIFFKTAPVDPRVVTEKTKGPEPWPLMTRAHLTAALICVALEQSQEGKLEKQVGEFLEGPVNDFWDTITGKYLMYSCPDPALKQSFADNFHLIKQVYLQWSSSDSKFGPRLSAADFQELIEETGLVDRDNESTCMSCFSTAQLNPSLQYELHHLVFVEFIESISRIALRTIENTNGLTDAKRVRMTLNMMIELPMKSEGKSYHHK